MNVGFSWSNCSVAIKNYWVSFLINNMELWGGEILLLHHSPCPLSNTASTISRRKFPEDKSFDTWDTWRCLNECKPFKQMKNLQVLYYFMRVKNVAVDFELHFVKIKSNVLKNIEGFLLHYLSHYSTSRSTF